MGRLREAAFGSDGPSRASSEAHYLRLAEIPLAEDEPRWTVDMEVEGRFEPAADLESVGGDLAVQTGGWDATLSRQLDDRSYHLSLAAEASFFDWGAASPVVPGTNDPFNDLYDTRIGALASFAEDEELGWFSGFEVILSGEDSADVQDSISVGAVSGVRYDSGENLSLSFGLAALTRLEDDAWVIPYFGFDWRITERLRFGTEGSRVALAAQVSDTVEATLAAEYRLRQYRLNDSNALPDGVFQDDQIDASLTLGWRPTPGVELTLQGGAIVWEEYTFLDGAGTKLVEFESDPALFGGLGLTLDL